MVLIFFLEPVRTSLWNQEFDANVTAVELLCPEGDVSQ